MNNPNQTVSIDEKTIAAKQSNDQFERLFADFIPFMRQRLVKYAAHIRGAHQREDIFSIITSAFYEAVQAFDAQKGRFIPFADRVICARVIDHLRKVHKDERLTAHPEKEGAAISETSINIFEKERRNAQLAEEIDQFEAELGAFGITMEALIRRSPKHERLRETCRGVVVSIERDPEMMQIIWKTRCLPIKAISEITGVPYKTLERLRANLLAALIVKAGDYQFISGYL